MQAVPAASHSTRAKGRHGDVLIPMVLGCCPPPQVLVNQVIPNSIDTASQVARVLVLDPSRTLYDTARFVSEDAARKAGEPLNLCCDACSAANGGGSGKKD